MSWSKQELDCLKEASRAGKTIQETAAQLGKSYDQVRYAAKRRNWYLKNQTDMARGKISDYSNLGEPIGAHSSFEQIKYPSPAKEQAAYRRLIAVTGFDFSGRVEVLV